MQGERIVTAKYLPGINGEDTVGLFIEKNGRVDAQIFDDKDAALKFLSESKTSYKIVAMMYGGMAIGTIATGIGILLKDPNVGQLQLVTGMTFIAWGATVGLGVANARRKSQTIDLELSAVQNI